MTPITYDGQVLANSIAYAALGNWFINKVKSSKFIPFINDQTYWINKSFAVVIALIAALGVSYTYSYSKIDGVFTLVLSGLTLAGLWANFKMWVISYALQQTGYNVGKWKEDIK